MKRWGMVGVLILGLGWGLVSRAESGKTKLLLVDSYHREYLWSQFTNQGFAKGLLQFGYLDNQGQVEALLRDDAVESSKAVVKRLWMDTKRKSSEPEIAKLIPPVVAQVKAFALDLLFLADDNAAHYIGSEFLDTDLPIVFWGINNTPVKYGLVDSPERPGHNVTGVVEVKYPMEALQLLKQLVPSAKTFAILSDATDTGRSNAKAIEFLARQGSLPLDLTETVMTNEFEVFKQKALALQEAVDALFVMPTTSKDAQGQFISDDAMMQWYMANVRKPDVAFSRRGVVQGLLCAADSDGYSQGFEGVRIAHDLLEGGKRPATYATVTPKRGPLLVNRERARMLGITIPDGVAEEVIEEASALKTVTKVKP